MFEMYFSNSIDWNLLCDAVAKHLFIPREDVGVVDLDRIDTKSTAVVIEEMDGDFPFGVSVYTELQWLNLSEPEFAQRLCNTLDLSCLVAADGDDDPYRWLLINASSVHAVRVDAPYFDGQCAFRIAETTV